MRRASLRFTHGRSIWFGFYLLLLASMTAVATAEWVKAAGEVEFPGTVISADAKTGKMAVKKESGGTRFTFVTNDKTHWESGLKGIEDLKKDDHIVVWYQVQGSQYIALRVAPKK
ncbi:MAG TPA: hypothetical protein VHF07_05730 [Nitrospiraceae bacterium]|nr:hypothetical protein [Nitrospiraceae bacterium]